MDQRCHERAVIDGRCRFADDPIRAGWPYGNIGRLGEMSGRIAPVGASVDPGGSDGFVLTMAFGGLSDFSAEGIPAGVSIVPVGPSGETRSEEPSGNAALAGGSDRVASEGVFGVAGSAGVSDSTCSMHSSGAERIF